MDEKASPPNTPTDETRHEGAAAPQPAPAPAVVRSASAPAFDSTPIYRVVEVTRDASGRLRKEGRIWHTDLNRMRKFGRAVASNSSAQKVVIADATGDVLEELDVPATDERQSRWGSWESIPLPPCPPKVKRKPRAKTPPPAPPPLLSGPSPFAGMDVDALRNTLTGATTPKDAQAGGDDDVEVVLP